MTGFDPVQEERTRRVAEALLAEGRRLGWWKAVAPSCPDKLDDMDPIGREEFLDLVARILRAGDEVRETVSDPEAAGGRPDA